ncbi:MAG: type IV pili methyl-accepting chemotaxis transducer N-terminal domain-containing protein, partial [Rhodospirillaceae bacterium]
MAFRFVDHERAPTLAYAIGLTLVALVTTAIWGVSITELSSQEKLSAEINVAGRQRMLSQRIVMFATDAVRGDPTKASVRMEQVRGCADLMERAHQALLIRDQEALQATAAEGISCRIGRPVAMAPPNLPPEQRNHFFGGDPSLNDVLRDFLASARSLSTLEKPAQEQALTAMLVSADRLLPERLDALTRALQTEAERANARLMRFKTIMWMATMVLLIIEVLFIFRPMSRVIRKALSERDEKVASLQDRESALSTATEAAELANRQKSRFLGAMNTALRTPLNAIIGYTKLMRQAQTDSVPDKVQTEALLNDIEASAKHLLYTVEEHLSAVRIESGDFNLSEDDIDLDGLIESCLRIVDAEARSARIALRHQPKVFQRHLRA